MANNSKQLSRSSKGTVPRNPQVWSPDDVAQLLAYLDHCLEYGVDFEDTVVAHLQASQNKIYTWRQIKRKLSLMWGTMGNEDPNIAGDKALDILKIGSKCLKYLDSELVSDLDWKKAKLASNSPQQWRHRLRSTSILQSDIHHPSTADSLPTQRTAKRSRPDDVESPVDPYLWPPVSNFTKMNLPANLLSSSIFVTE
jgi:hypothetical protein